MKPKILFFDLETSPMRGFFWGMYEQNILWVDRPSLIICFSAKWLHGPHITKALPDYPGYRPGRETDRHIIKEIWEMLDEAEVVIAQNGDQFDIKMINTEFIKHKMKPPSPYITIDTLKAARRAFRFPSNKLDDLGDQLEEGRKLEHEGKGLWKKCLEGDLRAWSKMKRYNRQDVLLLERVYKRFLPWLRSASQIVKTGINCVRCGSAKMLSQGTRKRASGIVYQQFQCGSCGGWQSVKKS